MVMPTLYDRTLDLLIVGGLVWLAAALGRALLGRLAVPATTPAERLLLGGGLGLGVIAYTVLALGLVGLLSRLVFWVVLLGLAIGLRRSLLEVVLDLRAIRSGLGQGRPPISLLVLAGITVGVAALLTLGPPVTYDALAYHLAGPRDWLQLGRLAPLPDNPPANYPATAQMLYLLLMAIASDSTAQTLHLLCGLATAALLGLAARHLGGPRAGWYAGLIFLSSPAITYYAWHGNVDLAVSLVETMAGYALLRALVVGSAARRGRPEPRWLVVAGLSLGLALGMKYVALGTLALAGIVLLLVGLYRRWPLRSLVTAGAIVGGLALTVGAPWYIKNWLWLDNPVWPTFFGGRYWTPVQASNFAAYSQAIGHPAGWPDSLLLPLRLYTGDHENPVAIPSLLFLLVPLTLLGPRRPDRLVLLGLAVAAFGLWSVGLREIRLLFSTFGLLSVLVGLLVAEPPTRLRHQRVQRWLTVLVPQLALVVAALPPLFFLTLLQPWQTLLGLEARPAYLARYNNQVAYSYLNQAVTADHKALMIGDGRIYHVSVPVRSDIFRDALPLLEAAGDSPAEWHRWLVAGGYTHVLVSKADLDFAAGYTPPEIVSHRRQVLQRMTETILEPVLQARSSTVYRLREAP